MVQTKKSISKLHKEVMASPENSEFFEIIQEEFNIKKETVSIVMLFLIKFLNSAKNYPLKN